MKRFSSIEIAVILLAVIALLVGFWFVLNPKEMLLIRDTTAVYGGGRSVSTEYLSKKEMIIYGWTSMVFGVCLLVAVSFPFRK